MTYFLYAYAAAGIYYLIYDIRGCFLRYRGEIARRERIIKLRIKGI